MLYTVSDILDNVNQEVSQLKFEKKPYSLFEPIEYILELGGKRVRPLLAVMGYNLYRSDIKQSMPVALAIEIFHNFTLLHDDLMDKADKRRGKPTVHIKWNDNIAVLSGDAMLIESYRELAKSPGESLNKILPIFTDTATEICCGQQLDMEFEQREDVSEQEYLEMIRLKTAVLLGCALKCGAIIADAPERDVDLLYQFGVNLGLAFQLMDDLLDVYGDPATFGKRIGGDILCNKKTLLQIKTINHPETMIEMKEWIYKIDYDENDKIEAVTNLYNKLNLKHESEKLIESYFDEAIRCLDKVGIDESQKIELKNLAESLLTRKS